LPRASDATKGDSKISSPSEPYRRIALAAVFFAAFYWLGTYVTLHGEPAAFMTFAHDVHGQAIGLAWILTNLCYPIVLAPLAAATLVLGLVKRDWLLAAATIVVVLLLCWGSADLLQHHFMRPRRTDWLLKHELSFSYPSSHAAISTGFYFYWGLAVLRSSVGRVLRYAAFYALTAVALAIMWSRLSLGAHYPTDLIGGMLLGGALIALAEGALRGLAKTGVWQQNRPIPD
jgi:membrane-associated phospholipid phosphatase